MVFAAFVIAVFAVYLIQSFIYSERVFSRLRYRAYFGCEETVEGEEVFMYEEISNLGGLPIPNAKVNTRLPDGLRFILADREGKDRGSATGETLSDSVQSVFVLRGHAVIRRKWRVKCEQRGVYRPLGCVMIVNNLFGTAAVSKSLEFAESETEEKALYVIPAIINLAEHHTENEYILGDQSVLMGLLEDPLENNGIREYRDGDPMNSFNWSATASHDKLLVNRYEFTRERRYNIILNLRSRDNERDLHVPSNASVVERSISICAALLDRAAATQPGIRLVVNTLSDIESARKLADASAYRSSDNPLNAVKPEVLSKNSGESTVEEQLFATRQFVGKGDLYDALRLLAELPLYYTLTLEKTLETVAEGELPQLFDGSFIIITPYVNDRILKFYDVMKSRGVKVAFFISDASQFDVSQKEIDSEALVVSG